MMSDRLPFFSFVTVTVAALAGAMAACGSSSSSTTTPPAEPEAGPSVDASDVDAGPVLQPDADAGPCTPRTGFETAVKLGALGGRYAHESLALGPSDEPYVAFVAYDLAHLEGSALYFTAYDTKTCAWKTPVKIDTVDNLDSNPTLREVQLVRDATNGRLHVAYRIDAHLPAPNGDTHMMLAHSSDEGATWITEEVAHDTGVPANNNVNFLSHPTLAVSGGKTVYAYYGHFNIAPSCAVGSECNAWTVLTRTGDTGAFAGGVVQAATGNLGAEDSSGAIAFDDAGHAGFAFFSRPDTMSPTLLLNYLTVGQTKAVAVFDAQGATNDQPALALAFEGTKPRVVAALQRGAMPSGTSVWFSASSDGATWGAPVEMPADGTDGMGGYMSIAANPKGGLTVAASFEAGSEPRGTCGGPKLMTTLDDSSFTTCGANPDLASNDIGFAGNYVQVAYTRSGKRVLVFDYPADSTALKAGVTVWREP